MPGRMLNKPNNSARTARTGKSRDTAAIKSLPPGPGLKSATTGDTPPLATHSDYPAFLASLKERIVNARTTAARAVNRELILLYWDIGRGIVEKQRTAGWGDSVIDQISSELQAAFPEPSGFSPRNLPACGNSTWLIPVPYFGCNLQPNYQNDPPPASFGCNLQPN